MMTNRGGWQLIPITYVHHFTLPNNSSQLNQGQNGQIPRIFEIFCKKNTVLELYRKIPLFMELEFLKLEFLGVLPPWRC